MFLPKLYNGKNKTFWMFTYEVTRKRQGVSSTALVPSLSERTGDFSGTGAVIVDPLTKTPFPNNVIPASRINPIGAALVKLYPAPNSADPARNYFGTPKGLSDNKVPSARVDHQLGAKDNLWGRFTMNAPLDEGVGSALSAAFPGFDQVQSDNNLQFAFGNVHIFSPAVINEANVGYVRFRRERHSTDSYKRNWIQELGIKGYTPNPLTWGAPSMTPTG